MAINHVGANSRGADMTEAQEDKYIKHNDQMDLLADRFLQGSVLSIGFDGGGSYNLSVEEWTSNFFFELVSDTSPSVDEVFEFNLPATQGQLALKNSTGFAAHVKVIGSPGTTVEVIDGSIVHLYCDAEDVFELKRDIYDMSFFTNTWTFDAIMGGHIFPRSVLLPANLPKSAGYAWVPTAASEADRIISLQKNEVEIGTITFPTLDSDAVLVMASDETFLNGDRLRLLNGSEGSPDDPSTLADVLITLRAVAL